MKADLRQLLKQARLQMNPTDRAAHSQAIIKQLKKSVDWSTIKNLHYFEPLHDMMEPDISPFIVELKGKYPQMKMVPARGKTPPTEKFDAILVPMLGFDPKTLHRIGYGGGYYDRFLANQPQAQKIGICFDQGKTENLPAEPHDTPLDIVITDSAIYKL